jgi:hypothetical protein
MPGRLRVHVVDHLRQYAIVVPLLDLVAVNRVDPRLTSKRVGKQRKAKLLWLIESAAGTAATDIGPERKIASLLAMAKKASSSLGVNMALA